MAILPAAALAELVERFDVDDPNFVRDPYPLMSELREGTRVFFHEPLNLWMLTRFEDVQAALRDRRLGRQYLHMFDHDQFGQSRPDPRWDSYHRHEAWSLLYLEPPDHTRIRRLVSKVFTPGAVRDLVPEMTQVSDRLLTALHDTAEFDLIADYAQPFSVEVICSMLGVPTEDKESLLRWSHTIVKMYERNATDEIKQAANLAAAEFAEYTLSVMAFKRRNPDDRLLSSLIAVQDEGDTLTDHEILCTTMVLLEAGHEATVNGLANGMRALLKHPDQYRKVVQREVPAPEAIEEMLRWDSPLQLFDRWVLESDVEIAGVPLGLGDQVGMLFGSAQRDPRRFADPDTFDIGRGGDTRHIGFGGGIHFCVGASVARQELAIALQGIVDHFPKLTIAHEPSYHPTFVIRGLQALQLASGVGS